MGFTKFDLSPEIMASITAMGFAEPTPVQKLVIPEAMKGHDVRACAQTGTGKTCAFAIPILDKLFRHPPAHKPSALVVVPTRELATQVMSVVHDISKGTHIKTALILGGTNYDRQMRQVRAGAQIVVATPGRLLDHMRQRTIALDHVQFVVLDEADRMLDMGFLPDIRQILRACPEKRQTMLFSATFPPEIQALANGFLKDPAIVEIAASAPAENVTQMLYPVSRSQKETFLQALLETQQITSAIIFSRTKHGADHLAMRLEKWGKSVTVIHSNRSQSQRDQALEGFRERKFQILVATDIAARGIDIKDISHVINFDVPQHAEDYVHRIGRTGRASASGDAFTLVAPDEEPYIKRIESLINKTIPRGVLPDFPYLVPPRLMTQTKSLAESFRSARRRIPTSRFARFK